MNSIIKHRVNNTLFNMIMYIRLLCGYFNVISQSKIICVFARIYCVLLLGTFITTFIIFNTPTNSVEIFLFIILCLDYVTRVFISVYTGDKYYFNFLSDVKIIDIIMGWETKYDLWATCVIVLFSFIHIISLISCNQCVSKPDIIISNIIMLSNTIYSTSSAIIFDLFWRRLQCIRKILKHNNGGSIQRKYRIIKNITLIYKNLLLSVNNNLSVIKITNDITIAAKWMPIIIIRVTLSFSVVLFGELIANEYHDIKRLLGLELLLCRDKSLRRLLYEAIEYMETCPPKYTILHIFPLDIKLYIGFVSMCVTYVIVFLQFSL
ncbi:uncharacterized protein [Epargyreus clarus]|uniref:uncharacterized protein n=1 Tax=Epargyreus clarus TaxID=520877 RepID=UPI003C2D8C3F